MKSREKVSKNQVRFEILAYLPEFQEKVKSIRRDFGIPSNGFKNWGEGSDWINKNHYIYSNMLPANFYKQIPVNPFRDRVNALGKDFNLPFNFYHSSLVGISYYIQYGKFAKIQDEKNWEITMPVLRDDRIADWVGIAFFTRPTKKEFAEAKRELFKSQREHSIPQTITPQRPRPEFERDVEIMAYISDRTAMPRKKKIYGSQYLEALAREVSKNPAAQSYKVSLKEAEKSRPDEVHFKYDQPLIRDIALMFKISPAAARQAIKRLDKLCFTFFSKKLLPDYGNSKRST